MNSEPTDAKTQKTQPRPRENGKPVPEPIEIPIPVKSQIERDFLRVVLAKHPADEEE